MAHSASPFERDALHVKRKIEPTEGLSFWFADVPEGGVTENTYLSACVSSNFSHQGVSLTGCSDTPIPTSVSLRSVISEDESTFSVEEHFHPKSTEHFTVLDGQVHLTLDGVEHVVRQGEHFAIPCGVVHKVYSPRGEHVRLQVRGDYDPVAERDFLVQMFTLVETVSRHDFRLQVVSMG